MGKKIIPLILFSIFLCYYNGQSQSLTHVLGEVIVEVKNDKSIYNLVRSLKKSDSRLQDISIRQISKEPLNLWLLKSDPTTYSELELMEKVIYSREVLTAQKNHLITKRSTTPNDPEFDMQWQYINTGTNTDQQEGTSGVDMDIDLAWDFTTGGTTANGDEIVACVIDDGIDENHEDFVDNLWVNKNEIPDNDIDDDGNGYVDDYLGWVPSLGNDHIHQVIGGDNNIHGTQVTGIIGAKGNNNVGVTGVNWDVKLMIIKGGGNEAEALAAYAYPYQARKLYNETNGEKGAFVVVTNASWGTDLGQPEDAPIWCDYYNKMGEIGILSCGATANSNNNVDEVGDLPTACSSDFLISVTNIDHNANKVSDAGYGKTTIDLGAFGFKAYTAKVGENYGYFGGTSGASPQVAGSVALLYAMPCIKFAQYAKDEPSLAARFIKHSILEGVVHNNDLVGKSVSEGILNTYNSMVLGMEFCESFFYPVDGKIDANNNLSWTNPENAIKTNLRYKAKSSDNWIVVNNISNPYTINNLGLCTQYEVQLQSEYSGNQKSEFSFSYAFTTRGCCYAPSSLGYEEINVGSVSYYQVSWETFEEAEEYTLEYKKINDASWTSVNNINSNIYDFTDFNNCELYQCRIKSNCELSNSSYSDTLQVSTTCGDCSKEYCGYSIANIPQNDQEWIERVSIHTMDNISGLENESYGNYLGYNIPNLKRGETYPLILKPGFDGPTYDEVFVVWIDYNGNQVFNDDEIVFDNTNDATKTEIQSMVSIPADALTGITRMRVAMRYDNTPFACGGYDYGEIEDYCVQVDNANSNVDLQEQIDYIISPNPFIHQFSISFTENVNKNDIRTVLYDTNGRKINCTFNEVNSEKNKISITNLDDLSSGVYFLHVIHKNQSIVNKVMKL